MKMVDAVVNGYIQVAVILLCVAFFCPPAALAALIGVLVSAFALRGDRPPERPHRPGEPPGSGGAVRGGH